MKYLLLKKSYNEHKLEIRILQNILINSLTNREALNNIVWKISSRSFTVTDRNLYEKFLSYAP